MCFFAKQCSYIFFSDHHPIPYVSVSIHINRFNNTAGKRCCCCRCCCQFVNFYPHAVYHVYVWFCRGSLSMADKCKFVWLKKGTPFKKVTLISIINIRIILWKIRMITQKIRNISPYGKASENELSMICSKSEVRNSISLYIYLSCL